MTRSRIFLVATLFFALCANAQIDKGNWMMGGSASFSNFKDVNNGTIISESTSLYINPNIGYFVIDKLAIGSNVGFLYFFPKGDVKVSTSYNISPFIRYYFLEKEKPINIFSEAGYGIELNSLSNNVGQRLNLKAGAVYFLNSSVGLEVALNYKNVKNNFNDLQNRGIYRYWFPNPFRERKVKIYSIKKGFT
jgi:hypothetical protein